MCVWHARDVSGACQHTDEHHLQDHKIQDQTRDGETRMCRVACCDAGAAPEAACDSFLAVDFLGVLERLAINLHARASRVLVCCHIYCVTILTGAERASTPPHLASPAPATPAASRRADTQVRPVRARPHTRVRPRRALCF